MALLSHGGEMSIINKAYYKLRSTDIGNYLHLQVWKKRALWEMEEYNDYNFVKKEYKRKLGRELDLVNPKRFTEKLQWLKIFYRNDLEKIMADKIEVKKYLEEKGYGYLLNETIAIYDSVDDFNLDELPDRFVVKAAHGSGWNLIVHDKKKVNWKLWKKIMRSWLTQDLYWFGREWNYKGMKKRLIVEKYLEDDSGELRDFKVFCFNGTPKYMQIDEGRHSEHKRVYVDEKGDALSIKDSHNNEIIEDIKFGEKQKEMMKLAEIFSKQFPHIRVDFYECNGKIYFGEFTFFDGSGFYSFYPDKWDFVWGDMIELPEPNYNLELYNEIHS